MNNVVNKKGRRLKPLSEARSLIICCGLVITLVAAIILFNPPQLLNFLSYRVYDLMLSAAAPAVPSDVPILVGIDDRSLKAYGQWPWPRYRLAQLVDQLRQAGVDAVALDMLMPEADRTSPEVISHERQRDLGETRQNFNPEAQKSNDLLLAEALGQMATVLSYKFTFFGEASDNVTAPLFPLRNIVIQEVSGGEQLWPTPDSALFSLAAFREAASSSGFANVQADSDGVLRRVPLLMNSFGSYYPCLALAALRLTDSQTGLRLKRDTYESVMQWGDRRIPLDEQGRLLLSYYNQEEPFAYYSASDVLAGKFSEGSLAGKIAFVGAWASGLGDHHATPVDKSTPGLEVHAVIASNLLSGDFLHQPAWARGAELFLVLLLGILSTLLIARFGFVTNLFLLVVGAIFPLGGTMFAFVATGVYIPPTAPLLLLLVNCSLLGIVRYGIEAHKVYTRTCDLVAAQDSTILGMVSLSAARDEETGEHILRTQLYVRALAQQLRMTTSYRNDLEEEDVELLFMSAPLHDIGKVGIPDHILHKPGKLTDEEFEIMKNHPVIGGKALADTVKPSISEHGGAYLDYARDVIVSHHEKWDGSGYPKGLSGDSIPLAGRLMALADVYDALISARVYKPSYSHDKARGIILEGRGKHFDPDVVDAFLAREDEFLTIAAKYAETPEESMAEP